MKRPDTHPFPLARLRAAAAAALPILMALVISAASAVAAAASAAHPAQEKPTMKNAAAGALSEPMELSAGPIRCRFADGELRYLYVGDKEIVRRVYFAVRDRRWDTILPQFTRVSLQKTGDRFRVRLEARCRDEASGVDYSWTGEIIGTEKGEITFAASGSANRAFQSNRIGLCVLYGSPSVTGQTFTTVDAGGGEKSAPFPELVSHALVAPKYRTLRYTTSQGMTVHTGVTGDAIFDMEDQRTYGDTSFKAYAPLDYPYPNIPQNVTKRQTVTIRVENAPKDATVSKAQQGVTVTLAGKPIAGAKMPRIALTPSDPPVRETGFGAVNGNRERYNNAATLTWGFHPSVHLFDDDTFRENAHAIIDQVKTARSFAPNAVIRIEPIKFDAAHPRPAAHPRNSASPFAAAWAAAVVKYLATAGVDEARFLLGPGHAERILKTLSAYSGRSLRAVSLQSPAGRPSPVEAFAIEGGGAGGSQIIILANLTGEKQSVAVDSLPATGSTRHELRRFTGETAPTASPRRETVTATDRGLTVSLAPFEVCILQP